MRIRVLELPMEVLGEATSTPFMLIIDRAPREFTTADQMERIREVAEKAGAKTVLVTSEEVDLDTDPQRKPRKGNYVLGATNG